MWAFAAEKGWYSSGGQSSCEWFVAPADKSSYDFRSPSGKGMEGGSPYLPLWFCSTAVLDAKVAKAKAKAKRKRARGSHASAGLGASMSIVARMQQELESGGCRIMASMSELRQQGVVRGQKRLNPKQRAKLRKKQAAARGGAW